MAITNNGVKNSLRADLLPTGYTRPTVTTFTDWEYKRNLTLSVLKATVEQAQVAAVAATGTITCATAIVGNTVTVNGLVYTAVAGAKANNAQFSIDTGDNATATDLADSITNDARTGTLNDVTATAVNAVVTCTSSVAGTVGNATTLTSSGATLAVSGATFSGGSNVVTSAAGTMTDIFNDAAVGLNKQIVDIVAADFDATPTVTTYADLISLTSNHADVSSGDGTWLTNTAVSYTASVNLYVKTA